MPICLCYDPQLQTQTWTETAPLSLKSHKKTSSNELLGIENVNLCVCWLYLKYVWCDSEGKEVRLYIYTHVLGENKKKSLAWCTNLALTSATLL